MFHTGWSRKAKLSMAITALVMLVALVGAVTVAQAETTPPPAPVRTPAAEDVKAGITRGDTRKYECAYVLPKGERPADAFCPAWMARTARAD